MQVIFTIFFFTLIISVYHRILGVRYKVVRVSDGDTIQVSNGRNSFPVRLIGIDAPESNTLRFGKVEKGGTQAKEFLQSFFKKNPYVKLIYDKQKVDKYNRHLCYVYAGGQFVNDYIVRKGYAKATAYAPNVKHKDLFEKSEALAKKKKFGIWKR